MDFLDFFMAGVLAKAQACAQGADRQRRQYYCRPRCGPRM